MRITISSGQRGRAAGIPKIIIGGLFAFAGTAMLGAAVGTPWPHEVFALWQQGALDPESLFTALFVGVFIVVGVGMVTAGVLRLVRGAAGGPEGPVDSPEPWLTRADWAEGHAKWEPAITGAGGAILFLSFFFLLMTAIAVYVTHDVLQRGEDYGVLALVWLFPVALALLAARSIRAVRQKRRFGRSVFTLDQVPGVLGGRLGGTVITTLPADREPADGFHVRLSCYSRFVRVSRSNGSTSRQVQEDLLWRDEQHLRAVRATDGTLTVPLTFDLPSDARPTRLAPLDNRTVWRLEVKARQPGLDYVAHFEVPVFEAAGNGLAETEPVLTFGAPGAVEATPPPASNRIEDPFAGPYTRGVRADLSPAGELQLLHVSPRAGLLVGIGLLVTGVAMIGAGAIAHFGGEASMLVTMLFGGLGLLIIYFAVRQLTVSTTVNFQNGQATFRQGMMGQGRSVSVPLDHLTGARVKISGTQVGDRAFYALHIDLTDGTTWDVTGMLRDRREADHLARLVNQRAASIPRPTERVPA